VFVISGGWRVLFLTYSPFHSPSTVNLERGLVDLRQNEIGAKVELGKGWIHFPDSGQLVDLDGAAVWKAEPVPTLSESQKFGIRSRLEKAALTASEQKGAQGLAPVLIWLIGQRKAELTGDVTEKIQHGLENLRIAIKAGEIGVCLRAVELIVGHGRGLTPSADDCLAGILLTLNRWKTAISQTIDLTRLNVGIFELARARTTSLSSTIIEAATLGQGDERILRVLDGIMTGEWDEVDAIQDLVRMGHSSGVDTLVGISLVLTA
jgi:hypothetical protein